MKVRLPGLSRAGKRSSTGAADIPFDLAPAAMLA
jgi:hypothetical protein